MLDQEKMGRIKELLNDISIDSFNQSLIQDNNIVFVLKDQVYRCVMPNQKTLSLAEDLENKLKIQYLQSGEHVTKKKLKKILKEKQDIDIDELEEQKVKYQEEMKDIYLALASVPSDEKDKIEELRKKKQDIESKFSTVIIEIAEYLSPSIEEQLTKKYYEYLAHACTEKSTGEEKWERVWNSLEDFETDNSSLPSKAIASLQTLMLNVRG